MTNTKRILMVGVLDVVGSTNIAMKKGFEQNGYYVEEYNYRTMLKKYGHEGMHQNFDVIINTRKFDLVVFCKVNQMNPGFLERAKVAGPTWYWFMDPVETARAMQASTYAKQATYCSATSSAVHWRFSMMNKNAYHMIEGFDPDTYFYEDLKKIRQGVFIGNATVPRIQKINDLKHAGLEITIFGHGWPIGMKACPPVFGEDERIEINQSRWVLNLVQDENIFSDRVTKAIACGAMVFSEPCIDLLDKDLTQHKWVYIFENVAMLKAGLEIFGTNIPTQKRLAEEMKHDYSWEAVCKRILGKVVEIGDTVR